MKKITFFILASISIIIAFINLKGIFISKAKLNNFQIGNILQQNIIQDGIANKALFKGQTINLKLRSRYNNLGIIEILINNYSRINKDQLKFKIQEEGQETSIYEAIYNSSVMDEGQFFPFGFPVISNSKDKTYIIQIQSLNGNINDSISISDKSKIYKAKYVYDKSNILDNSSNAMVFICSKITEIFNYFNFNELLVIYFFVSLPFLFFYIYLSLFLKFNKIKKIGFKIDYGLLLLICIYILTHLKFINYSQYWDSNWYLQLLLSGVDSIKVIPIYNVGEIIKSFVINFNFLGHSSMIYTGYLAIGQLFSYNNVYILNIQNMLLGVLGIIGFYKIMTHLFPEDNVGNIIMTSLFAFNPLFYATTIALNTDMPTLVFSVLLIYAFLKNNIIYIIIFSLTLIFSKETGIVIYLSTMLSYILIYELKRSKKYSELFSRILLYLIPFALFGIYFLATGGNIHSYDSVSNTGNSYKFKWDDNGFFTFGINSKNILLRFFQIFIMNFSWIGLTIFTVSTIISIIYDKSLFNKYGAEVKDKLRFIFYSYMPFIILTLLFLTMDFSRYVVPIVPFSLFTSYISVHFLIGKSFYRNFLLFIVLILSIIQVYKPLDPSAKIIFGKSDIGNNESSHVFGFRDGLVYNTQFYFVDQLSRKIESEINSYPVVIDTSAEYYFKRIKYISTVKELKVLHEDKILYIYVPWFDNPNEGINSLLKYYKITTEKVVDYEGYYVKLYFLEKLN